MDPHGIPGLARCCIVACNLGPLAVVAPLLEQMDVAAIMIAIFHLIRNLNSRMARCCDCFGSALSQPLALVNVAVGPRIRRRYLWGIPADKLTMIASRALDAFSPASFHPRQCGGTRRPYVRLPMNRLHYDTTHLLFCGSYDGSTPIPDALSLPPTTRSADFPRRTSRTVTLPARQN